MHKQHINSDASSKGGSQTIDAEPGTHPSDPEQGAQKVRKKNLAAAINKESTSQKKKPRTKKRCQDTSQKTAAAPT